ncbi:hypothetical protein [Alkaliphilus crotonatoxidans]
MKIGKKLITFIIFTLFLSQLMLVESRISPSNSTTFESPLFAISNPVTTYSDPNPMID